MKKIAASILFPVLLYSCNKQESTPVYDSAPVVTGYLNAGDPFSLQLSHQQSISSTTYAPPGLDSLDITVTCNDTIYRLLPEGNGIYKDSSLQLIAGNQYNLSFSYNGTVVSASTIAPSKPSGFAESETEISIAQITSSSSMPSFGGGNVVTLSWDNPDGSYYLVVVQNISSTKIPIVDTTAKNNDTATILVKQPTTGTSTLLTQNSFKYFGNHRIILFHVNPDYVSLYLANNSSSQDLSTPSTGIANGVGIFTGVNSDTLFLQVDKQ